MCCICARRQNLEHGSSCQFGHARGKAAPTGAAWVARDTVSSRGPGGQSADPRLLACGQAAPRGAEGVGESAAAEQDSAAGGAAAAGGEAAGHGGPHKAHQAAGRLRHALGRRAQRAQHAAAVAGAPP